MKCITCGHKYHWCSSCDTSGFEDELISEGYCTLKCWRQSEEYKKFRMKMEGLYDHIDEDTWNFIKDLLEWGDKSIAVMDDVKKDAEG